MAVQVRFAPAAGIAAVERSSSASPKSRATCRFILSLHETRSQTSMACQRYPLAPSSPFRSSEMFKISQHVLTLEAQSVGAENRPTAVDDEGGEVVLLCGAGRPDRNAVRPVHSAQRRRIAR